MKSALNNKSALFAFDIVIILLCIAGLYLNHLKANLPFGLTTSNNQLTVTLIDQNIAGVSSGDIVLKIDGNDFIRWEEVELYLDSKNIGNNVRLTIYHDENQSNVTVSLVNYYSLFDLSIIGIVGLFFIVFAILVRIKAPENNSAKIFHLASLGLGMVIMMTAGNYTISPFGFGYLNRILWIIAYSFTPVLFIHFTLSFVEAKDKKLRSIILILYLVATIHVIVLSYYFLDASLNQVLQSIKRYVFYFDSFFRLFVLGCIVIAISICIYAYKRATDLEERKRMQWLLFGFFIGPFSFIIFWILPILLTGHALIPEALVLIFLVAIPITFSIAIIKYHLMDINLLVRRSVVYTIILAIIIITYIGISSLITLFISDINPAFPSVLTALAVVALLQPVKVGVQKFVDKKFFRVEYNYREEQRRFLDDIKNIYYIQTLAELIVSRTDKLIPVEKIGFFELSNQTGRVKIIASKGWELLKGRSIRFESENLKTDMSLPVAVDDKVEPGLKIESADVKVFKRWGMVLVFPVKSPNGIIHGFLVLGAKKSGIRFLKDDIDLLNSVVIASALAIDKIKLQEELILEHLEAKRLEELNELKSFFMHTITHELKTPLTSIKLFTEKLQDKKDIPSEKSDFYLDVIEGESDKLRRLIDNILDYARIEKGMKSYNLKNVNLTELIKNAISSMKYQFMINRQSIEVINNSDEIIISADEEAIERAITNLLTNAIKYSSDESVTTVTVKMVNGRAGVEVRDNGSGISNEDLKNIFEPFNRVKTVEAKKIEGTGLGLAIVKHILDAHNGQVEVESEIGKGSKFTLWFSLADE
ncbi:MAG: ATP-binding protein [Ignavibacteriaceae bacterium]|nr:ATP-binding protein [Ignavibacteriaceae bacterium]